MAQQTVAEQLESLLNQIKAQEAELARRRSATGNPPTPIDQVSRVVREARVAQGLTQSDLKDLADVGMSTIVSIESGKMTVRLNTLQKVTGALGLRLYVGE